MTCSKDSRPVRWWISGETVEMRVSREDVAADNQRHVKYVPAGE